MKTRHVCIKPKASFNCNAERPSSPKSLTFFTCILFSNPHLMLLPHSHSHLVRASISNMMLKLWHWYQNCLSVHPVKTQVISSCVLWGVGDAAAQYITHSAAKKRLQLSDADSKFIINWNRVAVTSTFGFGFVGPVGHFWYEGLDKFIRLKLQLMPKSARSVATKVAMDGMIFGPIHLFVFFTYMGLCAGKTIPQVKEDLKKNYVPALVLEGGVWPVVQVFNFRYVPLKYQLLYVNFFCLLDSAFLSWLEQQKDAPWKQWFASFHSSNDKGGQC